MRFTLGDEPEARSYWAVIGDIAIALFLVFVLLLIAHYLRSVEPVLIDSKLRKRQAAVREGIHKELGADSTDVTVISDSPERQRLIFSSDVLFETCGTTLSARGGDLLLRTGRVLSEEGLSTGFLESIIVEGHTDKRPTGGGQCPFISNWELSTMRATAVVRMLQDSVPIQGANLSATGRAEYQPVSRGDHPDSLAMNRRIEVSVQYDRGRIEMELEGQSSRKDVAEASL